MFRDAAIAKALGVALPVSQANIMKYTSGRALDHAPGAQYAYSNYGYMLLGRINEKVTGKKYQDYVRQTVLAPRGITRMRLGKSRTKVTGGVASWAAAARHTAAIGIVTVPSMFANPPSLPSRGGDSSAGPGSGHASRQLRRPDSHHRVLALQGLASTAPGA